MYDGKGLQPYVFSGLDGFFRLAGEPHADSLKIRPFDYRWQHSLRWGRKAQSWLDVAFVDDRKIVSIASFKKDSAVSIHRSLLELDQHGITMLASKLTLGSTERKVQEIDEDGTVRYSLYYVCDVEIFEFATEEETRELQTFVDLKTFSWHLVGEVE
jgi:hypothetical protein